MKKYLSRIVCAVAVAAIAAYGVYTHQKETQVSNLTLANMNCRKLRLHAMTQNQEEDNVGLVIANLFIPHLGLS